jgi:hypothetical protein
MANRTLRSRAVELHMDETDFTAGESKRDCTVEQPEILGSGNEQNTVDLPPQQEIELDSTRAGTESISWPAS